MIDVLHIKGISLVRSRVDGHYRIDDILISPESYDSAVSELLRLIDGQSSVHFFDMREGDPESEIAFWRRGETLNLTQVSSRSSKDCGSISEDQARGLAVEGLRDFAIKAKRWGPKTNAVVHQVCPA